jgi:acyl-CoA synthetase (AMP-forming)/AMP-acid ligase II
VSCGHTQGDQKIVIVDPETLTQCSPDRVGEIWVSGSSVGQGYWNRPEETEHTFQAYLADGGEGPFLRTGDLGFLREGELFITGRLKDLIIIDGRNHYPQDIELTVEQSHPALRPGCCAAFSSDVEGEERLIVVAEARRRYRPDQHQAKVESRSNSVQDLPLEPKEVIRAVRRAVAQYHNLRAHDIVLLEARSIPKTSSGKVQRHTCRASYLAGTLDVLDVRE